MIINIPTQIEIPDFLTIDGERLEAEVHSTPYSGLTDNVYYESEDGRTYVNVKLEEQSVYVRYNGQSHTEQFGNIGDLVEYLMRSCNVMKSTKKSQPSKKSKPEPTFSEMVQKQRNKNLKKGVQISEGLEDELEKLYNHLDKAWNELAKAFDDVIDKSAYSELRKYADKCYDYYVAVGMLCSDVEDDMNWVKWRREHPEYESDGWDS